MKPARPTHQTCPTHDASPVGVISPHTDSSLATPTRRHVLGEEHPDTLTSISNLAITRWQMNQHIPAQQHMRAAAEGRASALGADHPQALASRQAAEQMQAAIDQTKSTHGRAKP